MSVPKAGEGSLRLTSRRYAGKILALGLGLSLPAFAQTNVTGKVAAADASPIAGAQVRILGKSVTTITGADGRFSLSVPAGLAIPSVPLLQPGAAMFIRSGRIFRPGAGVKWGLWDFRGRSQGEYAGYPAQPRAQAKAAAAADTLRVSANGFLAKDVMLDSLGGDVGTLVLQASGSPKIMVIAYRQGLLPVEFAVARLDQALRKEGITPVHQNLAAADTSARIIIRAGAGDRPPVSAFPGVPALPAGLSGEGFQIAPFASGGRTAWIIQAPDSSGAMYGTLELAEQVAMKHGTAGITAEQVNARFPFRAIKFNLPWDSYRDSPFLSGNLNEARDTLFWAAFIDRMAENRFNALTLWNLHPFPYMIRAKNFPKATPFSDAELAQWQALYRTIFRKCRERGIRPYIVNWNTFVSDAFKKNYGSNALTFPAFTGNMDMSPQVKRYTKESVTQVLVEYPDLAGIGTSYGEAMNGVTPAERQQWIEDVYVQGIKDAKRPVEFINRAPFTVDPAISRTAMEAYGLPDPVWVEIKFNWSHAHSSIKLIKTHDVTGGSGNTADRFWTPPPSKYKMAWMMRNEDFFVLRWGQPDFIRQHIARNGGSYAGGYFVGSECYIPAHDFSHQSGHPHMTWKYAFEKQWLFYQEWGRLLYDPATPDAVFAQGFDSRYGGGDGSKMVKAYALASKMPLRLASYYDFTWDFTLYSEGFYADPGFITLNRLIAQKTFDPDYLSIPDYVAAIKAGKPLAAGKISPLALADSLEADANGAMALLASVAGTHPTLQCEQEDVKAWAHLSLYFANKLRGGVALQTFRSTGTAAEKAKAVGFMQTAARNWADLVAVGQAHYQPIPFTFFTQGDYSGKKYSWDLMTPKVQADIAIAQGG